MLKLPQVTLICLTNRKFENHLYAMDNSSEGIEFGARKIIYDMDCDTIDKWNYKIIYDLPKYIDTEFALLIHHDGYVINPEEWRSEFLDYDYIGAPWPLPTDDYSYRDRSGRIVRVGNSVSLRSKKLMEMVANVPEHDFWMIRETFGNTNEDGWICCHQRNFLETMGCKFAPLEVAIHFSKEHEIPENRNIETFAFHTVDR